MVVPDTKTCQTCRKSGIECKIELFKRYQSGMICRLCPKRSGTTADGINADCITPERSALPKRSAAPRYHSRPPYCLTVTRSRPPDRNKPRRNGQPKKQRTGAARRNQTASSSQHSPEIRKKIRSSLHHSGIDLSAPPAFCYFTHPELHIFQSNCTYDFIGEVRNLYVFNVSSAIFSFCQNFSICTLLRIEK